MTAASSMNGPRLREDLDALEEIRLEAVGREVLLRSIPRGAAGRALQATGVALGSAVRFIDEGSDSAA
ncbi:MAG: hypothetical protein WD960_09595 [Gemmatimonadota bacterium]